METKNFKQKLCWLMMLMALLLTSQGAYSAWTGKFYFDNSATQWANVSLIVGHDNYRSIYHCTQVSGTDVWESKQFNNEWNDAKYAYFVNIGKKDGSDSSSASTFASGFDSRNITANQKSVMATGKIMVPTDANGGGTTWKTYTASEYTTITGNGRKISTNGFATDSKSYAYIKVKDDLSNADYGENSQTLKGWYWNTSSSGGSVVKASTYIGYNSADKRFLYRYEIGSYFTGLILTTSGATVGCTIWDQCNISRYYCNNNLLPYSKGTTCYLDLTGTISSDTKLSSFTKIGTPTISVDKESISLGNSITVTLTEASANTFGGNTYRIYADDGTNLYEICKPQTGAGTITWTPTTAGSWTLYSIVTDKYGAERKKSSTKSVTISTCDAPTPVAVKINNNNSATICSGNTATISTESSQSGYTYQLINSSGTVKGTVAGKSDGSAVTFSVGTADNAYKVHAYLNGDEGCAADMSNTVTLNVDQPTVAGTIIGAGDICSGGTKALSSGGATATNYKWKSCFTEGGTYEDASGTINKSTYSANPTVSTYYKLGVKNGECGWEYTEPVRVVVNNKPAQPGVITEDTPAPCINATGLTYSISDVATATGYTWTVPDDGWSITSGAGTRSITATAGTAGGDIKVTADNDCGSSAAQTLAVTVKGKAITVSPATVSANKYTPTDITATTDGETVTWAVTGDNNYLLNADKTVYTSGNVKQITVKAVSNGIVTATTTNDGCTTSATVTLSPTDDTETCN